MRTYSPEEQTSAENLLAYWRAKPEDYAKNILLNDPYEEQRKVLRAVARALAGTGPNWIAVKSGHKVGKALWVNTRIPTPSGWVRMGDIREGDIVFSEGGQPCNVIGATPIMYDHECFEVEFDDGTVVVADADHKWLTWSHQARKAASRAKRPRSGPSVVTTREIKNTLLKKHAGRNHAILTADPVECDSKSLPVDPYLLGVWLGDGTTVAGSITTQDQEIEAAFSKRYDISSRRPAGLGNCWAFTPYGFQTDLRKLGVLSNKHVPPIYLRGSIEQRRALLAGLLDTDGTCAKNGSVQFDNTNENLASAVHELVASLGFKPFRSTKRATLNGKDCGTCHRIHFTPHEPVFKLPRKLARQHAGKTKSQWVKQRSIVDVRETKSVPVRCITVDSPSSLFLISEAFIATHNSNTAAIVSLWFPIVVPGGRVILSAQSGHQIKNIIWPEVRRMYYNATDAGLPLGGQRISPSPDYGWKVGEGGGIVAVNPEKPVGMAGLSAIKQLFIVDEASEYSRSLFEVIRGNLATGGIILSFGNPTLPSGWFYEAFQDPDDGGANSWEPITISSLDTPNMKLGEDIIPGLAGRDWLVKNLYEELGIRIDPKMPYSDLKDFVESINPPNPFIDIRVLGRFPSQSSIAIFGQSLIDMAKGRWRPGIFQESKGRLSLGIDPAWLGPDQSAIAPRRGDVLDPLMTYKGLNGPQLAHEAIKYAAENRRYGEQVRIVIECMGVGTSAYDHLQEASQTHNLEVIGLNTSEKALDETKYNSLRSELYFTLLRWFEKGGAMAPDRELEDELKGVRAIPDRRNRKMVEPKDEIVKRLNRSPDKMSAAVLSTYQFEDHLFAIEEIPNWSFSPSIFGDDGENFGFGDDRGFSI